MIFTKKLFLSILLAINLVSCSTIKIGTSPLPITNVDSLPPKENDLSEVQLQRWSHLDILRDTIPGMSVDRAYEELLKDKKTPKKITVAVIDSGIDINHEDLKGQIWTNPKEIASNGIDDDKNGYIDDIHGWNFLGKSTLANFEFIRFLRRGDDRTEEYKKALAKREETKNNMEYQLALFRSILRLENHDKLMDYLGIKDYTLEDLDKIPSTAPQDILDAKEIMYNTLQTTSSKAINSSMDMINNTLNYKLNIDFDNRKLLVGDNPSDINDKYYGNNDVLGDMEHAKHGTHVAGIIAQKRNNNLGGDGIASEVVEIMPIRAVPDGDEYDKDIALAIRYAVDNGAKIINGSFGKYYDENSQWVIDAILYAEKKDVLIVIGAGNDGLDLDFNGGINHYPNDRINNGPEISSNVLMVGALKPEFSKDLVASFSNFGQYDLDIFAPGVQIYSSTPSNTYEKLDGTSMAAPNATGVAALVRAYYPKLKASEVKRILMDSGISVNKVVKMGDKKERNFSQASKSGKMINAYNALLMAQEHSKK